MNPTVLGTTFKAPLQSAMGAKSDGLVELCGVLKIELFDWLIFHVVLENIQLTPWKLTTIRRLPTDSPMTGQRGSPHELAPGSPGCAGVLSLPTVESSLHTEICKRKSRKPTGTFFLYTVPSPAAIIIAVAVNHLNESVLPCVDFIITWRQFHWICVVVSFSRDS